MSTSTRTEKQQSDPISALIFTAMSQGQQYRFQIQRYPAGEGPDLERTKAAEYDSGVYKPLKLDTAHLIHTEDDLNKIVSKKLNAGELAFIEDPDSEKDSLVTYLYYDGSRCSLCKGVAMPEAYVSVMFLQCTDNKTSALKEDPVLLARLDALAKGYTKMMDNARNNQSEAKPAEDRNKKTSKSFNSIRRDY